MSEHRSQYTLLRDAVARQSSLEALRALALLAVDLWENAGSRDLVRRSSGFLPSRMDSIALEDL